MLKVYLLTITKPDIIVLTETWISSDEITNYNLDGYDTNGKCNDTYRAGGVLVFTSSGITINNANSDLRTADVLDVYVYVNRVKFRLFCLYRLHAHNCVDFLTELDTTLDNISDSNIIVCGDINIDLLKNNMITHEYNSIMAKHGLHNKIVSATRVTPTSSTLIDHFFWRSTNYYTKLTTIKVIPGITDHSIITGQLNVASQRKADRGRARERKFVDFREINNSLAKINWDDLTGQCKLDTAFETYCETISGILARHTVTIPLPKKSLMTPWLSCKIISRVKTQERLRNRYRITKRAKHYKTYREYERNLTNFIARAKIDHYKRVIERNTNFK